jgi:hypothetical protein
MQVQDDAIGGSMLVGEKQLRARSDALDLISGRDCESHKCNSNVSIVIDDRQERRL